MLELTLYTTLGCHLCEQAEALIACTLAAGSYQLEKVEISESDALVAAYGVRIPVLRIQSLGEEIGWPFQAEDVVSLVQRVGA